MQLEKKQHNPLQCFAWEPSSCISVMLFDKRQTWILTEDCCIYSEVAKKSVMWLWVESPMMCQARKSGEQKSQWYSVKLKAQEPGRVDARTQSITKIEMPSTPSETWRGMISFPTLEPGPVVGEVMLNHIREQITALSSPCKWRPHPRNTSNIQSQITPHSKFYGSVTMLQWMVTEYIFNAKRIVLPWKKLISSQLKSIYLNKSNKLFYLCKIL